MIIHSLLRDLIGMSIGLLIFIVGMAAILIQWLLYQWSLRKQISGLCVFAITDGGEQFYYINWSSTGARFNHIKLNYTEAGVPLDEETIEDGGRLSDSEVVVIEGVRKTAKQWCEDADGPGLLCATVF